MTCIIISLVRLLQKRIYLTVCYHSKEAGMTKCPAFCIELQAVQRAAWRRYIGCPAGCCTSMIEFIETHDEYQ